MTLIPFIMALSQYPMAIPTTPASLLWAVPVSIGIAVVYKAVKLEKFTWPIFAKEVTLLVATIISVLILTGVGLILLAKAVGIA